MKPANVFQLELSTGVSSRRALVMRLGLAFLLGLPFVLARMPVRARVGGLAMLVVFVGFFGAAVALVRRRADGHWQRLWLLPVPRWVVWSDYVLASVALDLVQTAPVFALYVLVNGVGVTIAGAVGLLGVLCVALVVLNALGALLAHVIETNAEVHLAAALATGLIALFSGLFPAAAGIRSLVDATARWSPVGHLARALEGIADGTGAAGDVLEWACIVALAAFAACRALGGPGVSERSEGD